MPSNAAPSGHLLVWLHEPSGPFTYELEPGTGRVLRRDAGVQLVVGSEVRSLVKATDRTLAWECDDEQAERPTDPPKYLTTDVIEAVRASGARERLLYATQIEGNQEYVYRADVVATVGTVVIVHLESYYYYPCSAHGYPGEAHVWVDAATGQFLDVTKRLEPSTLEREEARRGLTQQVSELSPEDAEGLDPDLCQDLSNLSLSQVKPRFDGRRWTATYVMGCGVPYAVSAIYELQQEVVSADLPLPELAAGITAPKEALRLLEQVPRATLGGFGVLPYSR